MTEHKLDLAGLVLQAGAIEAELVESGGELEPQTEALLEVNQNDMVDAVDRFAYFIDHLNASADKWTDKARTSSGYAKSCKSAADRLKDRIKETMVGAKRPKVSGRSVYFTTTASVGKLVVDLSKLPEEFKIKTVVVSFDNALLKGLLKQGRKIPGVELVGGHRLSKFDVK